MEVYLTVILKVSSEKRGVAMTENRGDIEFSEQRETAEEKVDYPESAMLTERLEWFQDLKLGVIMHWGLYAEAGIVESWQLSEEDQWAREPVPWREDINQLKRDYWGLNQVFNPTEFEPVVWAKACKEAGIHYLLVTTKHHDGFNMYDTQTTDYKIGGKDSPYKGPDPLKAIFEAFREEGIAVGAYYSKADWHSPYYWLDDDSIKGRRASYDTLVYPEIWAKYVAFVHEQIREITHNYGELDFLWLDAGWSGQGKEDLQMDTFAELAREVQPNLIIVDRTMGGRHENYVTPERKIPELSDLPQKVWESNIPLGNDWGFNPNDTFKSSQEVIEMLVKVVARGGNLVLGVGPTPQGTLTNQELEILADLGTWLETYGRGIYGTRKLAELTENSNWLITSKQDAYYAFLSVEEPFPKQVTGQELQIDLSEIEKVIEMSTGRELRMSLDNQQLSIKLPETCPETIGYYGMELIKK